MQEALTRYGVTTPSSVIATGLALDCEKDSLGFLGTRATGRSPQDVFRAPLDAIEAALPEEQKMTKGEAARHLLPKLPFCRRRRSNRGRRRRERKKK